MQKLFFENDLIETIYFGGGTPSQLNIKQVESILSKLYSTFNISANCEITFEANPDDITENYLIGLNQIGINRLSLGIQSFDDTILQFLNRRHNSKKALFAIDLCKKYFNNISIDLIYGIPRLSNEIWKSNLKTIVETRIPHISAYHLTYEKNTRLYQQLKSNKFSEIDEHISCEQYQNLLDITAKYGYINYEISNFAFEGMYSKHNSSYWKNKKYLGLGPSAHSYNHITRKWNLSNIKDYIIACKELRQIPFENEILDLKSKYNDYIITSIRTIWGIDSSIILSDYGQKYYTIFLKSVANYIHSKHIVQINTTYKLTDKGKFLSDRIVLDLIA